MRKHKIPKQKTRKLTEQTAQQTVEVTLNNITREKCACGLNEKISWWWPWCIVALTTAVRIHYVISPKNWWILHPDETFQSMEVSFSEVYGYGFRPYEYLPPPSNTNVLADAQLLKSGMYGLRSPVYPKMFMVALYMAKLIGIDSSAFMVCRIFNVVITSLLPVTVYWFVLITFKCRLLALLVCVMTSAERHLAVFATHTIVNSFLSPLMFAGLTMVLQDDIRTYADNEKISKIEKRTSDQNGNIILSCADNGKIADNFQQDVHGIVQRNKGNIEKNLGGYTKESKSSSSQYASKCIGGFILGMSCYIRPDNSVLCVSVILPIWWTRKQILFRHFTEVTVIGVGGAIACIIGVTDDFRWYGAGILSPIQWYMFNIMSGKPGRLFGSDGISLYMKLFACDTPQTVTLLILIVVTLYCQIKHPDIMTHHRTICAICFAFVSTILIYSAAAHKEKRFLHNSIVLYLIIIGYSLHTFVTVFKTRKTMCSIIFVIGFIGAFVVQSYSNFPSYDTKTISDWTYNDPRDSVGVNVCLDWLRQQDGVRGVFVNASLYDTAGFTILKHDVHIIVKMHHEFYLFNNKRQTKLSNRAIRPILRYDDYIHESNHMYLSKLLSNGRNFNYFITREDTVIPGCRDTYEKVFAYGDFNVFKSNDSESCRKFPKNVALGNKAVVLEYEANWLITNGLYKLAIERIEEALELDGSRVRLYQQLFVCYHNLNDKKMLLHYQEECFRQFDKAACLTQQERVVLNEEYKRFYR